MGQKTNFTELQLAVGLDKANLAQPNAVETLTFFLAGAQSTGTDKYGIYLAQAATIIDVRARLSTAPTTTSFIADVMLDGTTIFTTSANRPTIPATANVSTTTLPDVVAIAAGQYLRVDIIQIGSGTPGSNLALSVTIKRNLVA